MDCFPRKACREWAMGQDTCVAGPCCHLPCVTFCKLLSFSEPSGCHLLMGITTGTSKSYCREGPTNSTELLCGGAGCGCHSPGRGQDRKGRGRDPRREGKVQDGEKGASLEEGRGQRGAPALPKLPSNSPPARPLPTRRHLPSHSFPTLPIYPSEP